MNAKEMEIKINELLEARISFEQRVINVIGDLRSEIEALRTRCDGNSAAIGAINDWVNITTENHVELKASCDELRAKLDDVTAKVEGRNKSAAVKRNMTDADALRVLTGDLKDIAHKEAAEQIGLTYAQIYSCRLEFTFKHVHKDLREAKWVNPWAKK